MREGKTFYGKSLFFPCSSFSQFALITLIQLVDKSNQCKLKNSTRKQGKRLHQLTFRLLNPAVTKDYIQFIAQAAAQSIAIHPIFAFAMSDHRFNG